MPELPEVEATVRYLAERITGEVITDTQLLWERTLATHSPLELKKLLAGASIERAFRRGKFVGLSLSGRGDLYLFIHLRMSGSLDVISSDNPLHHHDRVSIELSSGKSIRFNDTRKFGRIYLYTSLAEIEKKLGIEPLLESFTPQFLYALLQGSRGKIKPLLLDQSFIAGLGNIYVDESLWKAAIHPNTIAHTISMRKVTALHQAIQETLKEAISLLGTDFGDNVVHGGMYRPSVYGREGEPCARCGRAILRIVVGQRGTHICTRCQKE